METVNILGDFVYSADVKPKGARLVRRIRLRAPTQYEFRSVSSADAPVALEIDASEVNSVRRITYRAFDGRLWLPAESAVTPQAYASLLADWPLHGYVPPAEIERVGEKVFWDRRNNDPILNAHPPGEGTAWPIKECAREDDFIGQVLASNRAECQQAFVGAARDQIFVDGILHRAFPAPVWVVDHNTETATVRLVAACPNRDAFSGHVPSYGGRMPHAARLAYIDAFDHDQFDVALAWAAECSRCEGGISTEGRIVADAGGYDLFPVMSYAALTDMRLMVQWAMELARHLPPNAFSALGRLNERFRCVSILNASAARDSQSLLQDVQAVASPLRSAFVPLDGHTARDAILNFADRLAARAAFDAKQVPAAQSDALASLAS